MKDAKNATYFQIDHHIENIFSGEGIQVLPSKEAWEKFIWTRKLFGKKPKEGYFIWVQKEVNFPLSACITIVSPKISQDLENLLVIERGIHARANVVCNAKEKNLYGIHRAKGRIILKEGATLEYNHVHEWGQKDFVSPDYEFFLGKNSHLIYNYKNLLPPEKLELKTKIHCAENSSLNLNFVINGQKSKISVNDSVFLEGKNSQGVVRLRLLGREKSDIEAVSKIFAISPSRGHLDCQGLLIDKTAKISLTPQLVCQNKESQLTHEASLGKISEEELTYLRMRGLSEKEAIDLIVSGFLNK
ncbi:MAG: SufD family Fe-S cluster assembly protein [Candidatus Pacebacteria bacterium]|nr:SufD family Fe-S cluster assembly protein [Candidatus Paceibacterota bacterium]